MKHFLVSRTGTTVMLLVILAGLFSCSKKHNDGPKGPAITGFSADSVWIGKIITINGSGFSTTPGENEVRIGSLVVPNVIAATATELTIKVPDNATSAKVFVKINGVEIKSPKELSIVNQLAWQRSLGGTGGDYAMAVTPSSDGGYLVAGYTASANGDVTGNHGNNDYWVVKLNADRSIAWQKTLGGTGEDQANSIVALADGGCVVAGSSASTNGDVTGNHGNSDYWIVKLNATGNIVWQRSLGGTGFDEATAIIATSTGYIVAGHTSSNNGNVTGNHGGYDFWIVWLDVNGALIKQKTYGGTAADRAYSITASSDGGNLIAGSTASTGGDVTGNHGSSDYWVIKLNAGDTTIAWQKCLGGASSDIARSVIAAPDGNCLVAGYANSTGGDVTGNHGSVDYWVVKLNATGGIIWQKSLGATAGEQATAIAPAQDGGCAVAGLTNSTDGDVTGNHGSIDSWIVRLNAGGDIVWKKTLGGTLDDGPFAITASGRSFITAGFSSSNDGDVSGNHGDVDCWLVKIWD